MKLYKLPTAIALSLLFCLTTTFPASRASQGQRRTLTLSQHKDPPIEIVSIDLAGKALLPNTEFSAPDGWTEDLHITVKNNSEEPISRIEMILGIFTKPDAVALTAHYWFGNRQGTESLPPGSTVVLTHIGTKGDNNAQGTVKLSIASVIWNGDDSLKWDGGGIRRKVPSSEVGEPPTYHADPQPLAKYQYPKWFKPDAKIVRARSMLAVTYCNQKITDNSFKYCNVYCTGTQYRCWVPLCPSIPE